MMISLLYNNPSERKTDAENKRLIYHLSLDRSFSRICSDINKTEYFFSVLSSPSVDKDEIELRKEILCDFRDNDGLFEAFRSLYGRFEELREMQSSIKKNNYRIKSSQTSSLSTAKNIVQTQAIALKKALLFLRGFGELLSKYDIKSRGLKKFKEECKSIYEKEDYKKILNFCGKYENMSIQGVLGFRLALDGDGRAEDFSLVDSDEIRISPPEEKPKGFFRFKKTEETKAPFSILDPKELSFHDFFDNMSTHALSDISNIFESLSQQIFDKFSGVNSELDFYEIALDYVAVLNEKSIPYCFPKISEDGTVSVKELKDLYLLMTKNSPSEVVSNDLEMAKETNGVVVFGNNGSGKTVFLRSIATMQLLAQAGLPVTAKEAEISLFSDIFTQFSEAEKEFCEGNDAGRFEQEVRELAAIVDTLKDGSLVFLNETFQSTAYAEGAEGLYYLLKYFSERGIRWILVSHLTQIKDLFSDGEAVILKTAPGYKIITNAEK